MMRLTDKQNTLEILTFGAPERVTGGITPAHHVAYFGVNHENAEGDGHHLPVGSTWKDIWGVTWHRECEGVMGFPRGNPLADLADTLDRFAWPDPNDERLVGQIYAQAAGCDHATHFLVGSHRDTLWERAYMLCGMENLLCLLLTEPEAVRVLLHRIMDFQLGIARHYLAAGVDVVECGDDLGTQIGLLLSPELIHTFLVPEYRRLFQLYRRHGVLISFHSCGHIEPLLDTFIELGVSVLNPIQANANDLATVRAVTQGRLALQGGLSSGLLCDGPPDRIRAEVQRLLALLGQDGGYFCMPDQWVPWPPEHYAAYEETLAECGCYPLPCL